MEPLLKNPYVKADERFGRFGALVLEDCYAVVSKTVTARAWSEDSAYLLWQVGAALCAEAGLAYYFPLVPRYMVDSNDCFQQRLGSYGKAYVDRLASQPYTKQVRELIENRVQHELQKHANEYSTYLRALLKVSDGSGGVEEYRQLDPLLPVAVAL